jgi:hypothetical protein
MDDDKFRKEMQNDELLAMSAPVGFYTIASLVMGFLDVAPDHVIFYGWLIFMALAVLLFWAGQPMKKRAK